MKPSFHNILWNMRNEEILLRLKVLAVKPDSNDKGGLITTLKRLYAGDGLRRLWESLSDLEQAAVSEAAFHLHLNYSESRVLAKYGRKPDFFDAPHEVSELYREHAKYATRMHLFIFSTKDFPENFIPADLAERLREFIPPPNEAVPESSDSAPEETGIEIRSTEPEARVEVMALLRLAEAGELRVSAKTAMPSAAGVSKILDMLPIGDFYPPEVAFPPRKETWHQEIGAIKPVAWPRLLVNAGYVDVSGTKSKLTRKGLKALSEAPHEIIKEIWSKWVVTSSYDEFNRVDAIKGQQSKGRPLTFKPERRLAILQALKKCPVGKWISAENFSSFMIAADHLFEVARVPSILYIAEHRYGNLGYSDSAGWKILQYRYILSLLFEYAATLGMIDIAYVHPKNARNDYRHMWGSDELEWLSRYDGLRSFRINEFGAYCLGMAERFVPTQPESSLVLEVGSNLVIRRTSGDIEPADQMLLEAWAEPVDRDAWRLHDGRAVQAVERGQKAEDFIAFLRSRDPQPIPQTVEGFLAAAERDGRAVRNCGEAFLFECRDEATAELICAQKDLRDICHRCGKASLVVLGSHADKFRRCVGALRLGIF